LLFVILGFGEVFRFAGLVGIIEFLHIFVGFLPLLGLGLHPPEVVAIGGEPESLLSAVAFDFVSAGGGVSFPEIGLELLFFIVVGYLFSRAQIDGLVAVAGHEVHFA
jgi:hypothetical protein